MSGSSWRKAWNTRTSCPVQNSRSATTKSGISERNNLSTREVTVGDQQFAEPLPEKLLQRPHRGLVVMEIEHGLLCKALYSERLPG